MFLMNKLYIGLGCLYKNNPIFHMKQFFPTILLKLKLIVFAFITTDTYKWLNSMCVFVLTALFINYVE